ncbi:MAG: hypothetical protein KatS3mg083_450 [Candidatus Dojkabacteria bacterium]|nr:MAG: hypothetical protein KatS3mg083_450 [Candidatus Dojkabacteria bacterium]
MSAKKIKQKTQPEEAAKTEQVANNNSPQSEQPQSTSTSNKRVIMTVAFVVGVLLIIILGVGFYLYTKPMQGTSQGSDTSSSTQDGSSGSSANVDASSENSDSVSNGTVTPTPTASSQQNQNGTDNQQNASDVNGGQANNNTNNNSTNNNSTNNNDNTSPSNPTVGSSNQYVYVAENGDSLHWLVRKAILNYLKIQNIQIDDEQKIFAETNIVRVIGPRHLMIGETVSISRELVAEWVTKSRDLTPAEKDAWRPYSLLVDYSLSM